jgi:hypothetical protein
MSLTKSPPPPRPRINAPRLAELLASLVVGHIRERCEEGLDIKGQRFLPYSDRYAAKRLALGRNEEPVDMLMTGRLLKDVQVVERSDTYVIVGVGTGTSSQRRAPTKRNRRKRAGERRGPPHNLLGQWHQYGAGRNKVRRWFGVSPAGEFSIRREVLRRRPPLLNA